MAALLAGRDPKGLTDVAPPRRVIYVAACGHRSRLNPPWGRLWDDHGFKQV